MENQENLMRVFTGSVIEAQFIKRYLEDNKIEVLLRDTRSESITPGWASGAPEDFGLVFVLKDEFEKAMKLIEKYQNSSKKKKE